MRRVCALMMMLALSPAARGELLPDGGVTAAEVAKALTAKGYPADVSANRSGDPVIRSSTGKVLFNVYFFQCGQQLRCASLQFSAPSRHRSISASTVVAWNREERFGRATLDGHGVVWLSMDVESRSGMTTEALKANVERWILVMNAFDTFVTR